MMNPISTYRVVFLAHDIRHVLHVFVEPLSVLLRF